MLYLSVQIWFWIALAAAVGLVVGVRLQRGGAVRPVSAVAHAAGEAVDRLERELEEACADAVAMKGRVAELEDRLSVADGAVPEAEVVRLRERIAMLERDLETALPAADDDADEDEDEEPETFAAEAAEETEAEAEEAEADAGDDEALPAYGLAEPRGEADDLRRISGIGAKLAARLNELGVYHFSQIASLGPDDVARLDAQLKTRGRIVRDDWPGQAAALLENRADAA